MNEGEHQGDGREPRERLAREIVVYAHNAGSSCQRPTDHEEEKRPSPLRFRECLDHDPGSFLAPGSDEDPKSRSDRSHQ